MGDKGGFQFTHPYSLDGSLTPEEIKEFVIELVTDEFGSDHVKDIDWDECWVVDD
jgi:hypothetical protein